jgi:hypothetical protein
LNRLEALDSVEKVERYNIFPKTNMVIPNTHAGLGKWQNANIPYNSRHAC